MFSSSADAARRRRPTDVVLAVVALLVVVSAVSARWPTAIDRSAAVLLRDLDPALGWFWPIGYAVLAVWLGVLVLAPVLRHRQGRLRLLWDYGLGLGLGLVFALAVGAVSGIGVAAGPDPVPSQLSLRVVEATALVVTAAPHLTRPFRIAGRIVLALGVLSAVALEVAYVSGALAAVAVGLAAAASTHLLRGSPGGLLTDHQTREALLDLGIEATRVASLAPTSVGEQLMAVRTMDDEELQVRIIGRDAWDAQLVGTLWTSLTRRGEPPQLSVTRRERVQREAMVTLLAERAGVPVLPVVTAGQGLQGEAMLVTESPIRTLADPPPAGMTDERIAEAWAALIELHGQGIAHRRVSAETLVERSDGTLGWSGLGSAQLAPSTSDLMLDRVHLLVTTWLLVGPDRAVDGAIAALGTAGLSEALPYLQDPALSPPLRRSMGTRWNLDDLRHTALEATGAAEVPVVELRRVTAGSLVKLLLVLVVVSTVVGLVAGVDFAAVAEELRDADMRLLLLALAVAPLAQVAFSFSTLGACLRALPYLPVLLLQYAIQFLALALPTSGARIALQIRFFERLGVPSGAAVSTGLIDGVSGFVVQVSLLALIALTALPGFTTQVQLASGGGEEGSSGLSLIWLALVIGVVWGAVTVAIPQRRARARRAIPRFREALKDQASTARSALEVVKRPAKLTMMMGGNMGGQLVQAIVLGICLAAFDESASLSQLILVNTFASLFVGVVPVPGGIGVAEATYTFGLLAIGVPSAAAVSTAIAFRLVTFYLPPLWGSLAMRWLRKHAYV